jgi:hypothetical protein
LRLPASSSAKTVTVVLHVGRQFRATDKAAVEAALGRLSGVRAVEANPVAQTATVTYDPFDAYETKSPPTSAPRIALPRPTAADTTSGGQVGSTRWTFDYGDHRPKLYEATSYLGLPSAAAGR